MTAIRLKSMGGVIGRLQLQVTKPLYFVGEHGAVDEVEQEVLGEVDEKNVILDTGLAGLAASMSKTAPSGRVVYAITLGDQGTLSSNPFVPKSVDPARTALYHELGTRVTPDVRLSSSETANALTASASFDASTDFVVGDFADASKLYINEAMCFLGSDADGTGSWVPFAMRTFKSVPFAPVDAVTCTVKWTFTFERG